MLLSRSAAALAAEYNAVLTARVLQHSAATTRVKLMKLYLRLTGIRHLPFWIVFWLGMGTRCSAWQLFLHSVHA
jgi:hypothetical protein